MLEKWSKSSPSQEYVQRLVPELVHHGRRVAIEREQVLVDNHCRGLLSLGNPPHVVNLFLLFPPRLGLGLLNGLSGRGSDTIARTRANEYVEPTNMVPDPAAILSAIPIPDARSNLHPYFGTNTRSHRRPDAVADHRTDQSPNFIADALADLQSDALADRAAESKSHSRP